MRGRLDAAERALPIPTGSGASPALIGKRTELTLATGRNYIALMRHTAAVIALVGLSWSQLVAVRCDMGTGAPGEAGQAAGSALHSGAHHTQHLTGGPPAPHGPHHSDGETCLMTLACGISAVRPTRTVPVVRIPAIFAGAAFFAIPTPVAPDLTVEPTPPRQAA